VVVGTLRINDKQWSWLVSNETNESIPSHQIEVICRITNMGSSTQHLSKPSFGPTVRFWYREAGVGHYSSGIPPGSFRQASIVTLAKDESLDAKKTLSLPHGDYEIYFEYLAAPTHSNWIISPAGRLHCE
jgi:hypothetical protein